MPFNKVAKYPKLLDLNAYSESQRTDLLYEIYERDIFNNSSFRFKTKEIRPTKSNSDISTKDTLFAHLINKKSIDHEGVKRRDCFDMNRSVRLHWIKHHVSASKGFTIFDHKDRINGRTQLRTYIYNQKEKYVIILEPKRGNQAHYYLLTAYYLDEKYGEKQILQKYKKRELP